MKILIKQLSEGEHAFQFDSAKDTWVKEVLQGISKQGYALKGDLALQFSLTKLEPNYYLKGQMRFSVGQCCARCAEDFALPIAHPFAVAMVHVSNDAKPPPEFTEAQNELDINFFDGNEIDLKPVISEQFFLSLPYQSTCSPDCKGICQQCGVNLNQETCECAEKYKATPFSVLKNLTVVD